MSVLINDFFLKNKKKWNIHSSRATNDGENLFGTMIRGMRFNYSIPFFFVND